MMIQKRLLSFVPKAKIYTFFNVLLQWLSMLANAGITGLLCWMIMKIQSGEFATDTLYPFFLCAFLLIFVRFVARNLSVYCSYLSSREVKKTLRSMLYEKLMRLGLSYRESISSASVVQVMGEGCEQLETYFASYLPQFFYALLAPVTLFLILCMISVKVAAILLICVPLIPVSIALVQTWAKKLLGKYWGQYNSLADSFLENLQGLTTLKIYQADKKRQEEMNAEAEKFRRITMKVLSMQLNSIIIMDLVAYGGAAVGMTIGLVELMHANISFAQFFFVVLISAEFFLPMRQLGSFFHVAMNGMAATDLIYTILDAPEKKEKTEMIDGRCDIRVQDVSFSYDGKRKILDDVSLSFPEGSFSVIVGESGSGKSTLASIIDGRITVKEGQVFYGDIPISEIAEKNLLENVNYLGSDSFLFSGTVRENLAIARDNVSDEQMWQVLEKTNLADYLKEEEDLDTRIQAQASNLSGGQKQRLALARALLHDTQVFLFDEVTSNVDAESEAVIMNQIESLKGRKTVILITHRLANAKDADCIFVMEKGRIVECGTHEELLQNGGIYAGLWQTQNELENFVKEAGR